MPSIINGAFEFPAESLVSDLEESLYVVYREETKSEILNILYIAIVYISITTKLMEINGNTHCLTVDIQVFGQFQDDHVADTRIVMLHGISQENQSPFCR